MTIGKCRRAFSLLLIILLQASSLAGPPGLDGREVLLIVSNQRHDLDGEWLELTLRGMRHKLGLTGEEIPVVRMGIDDKDANPEHFSRLGLKSEDLPLVCLARWSEAASEGPAAIIDEQIATTATRENGTDGPRSVFVGWLERTGRDHLIERIAPKTEPVEVPVQDEPAEQGETKEQAPTPADLIAGKWRLVSSSGWAEFVAHPDGRLEGKGALHLVPFAAKIAGHWEVTGETERTFQLHWKNGNLHNVKIHENGRTMEGRGISDGNVSAKRLD